MTLKQIQIFISVAKNESVTKAAQELYMTQPSVSLAIQEIEKEFGIVLFKRIKQRIKITEDGQKLFQYASEVLKSYKTLENFASSASSQIHLVLACTLSVGEKTLPGIMKDYPNKNRAIISYKVMPTSLASQVVAKGEADLGIIIGPVKDQELFNSTLLTRDRLAFVASPNTCYPQNLTIEEVANKPLLLREKGSWSRDVFEAAVTEKGLTFKALVEADANGCLVEFAMRSFGIAVLPYSLVKESIEAKRLREISIKDSAFYRDVFLVWRKSSMPSAAVEELSNYLKVSFAD
jgi:DNA-binding transcriptional LysR family regulator